VTAHCWWIDMDWWRMWNQTTKLDKGAPIE